MAVDTKLIDSIFAGQEPETYLYIIIKDERCFVGGDMTADSLYQMLMSLYNGVPDARDGMIDFANDVLSSTDN